MDRSFVHPSASGDQVDFVEIETMDALDVLDTVPSSEITMQALEYVWTVAGRLLEGATVSHPATYQGLFLDMHPWLCKELPEWIYTERRSVQQVARTLASLLVQAANADGSSTSNQASTNNKNRSSVLETIPEE